MNHPPRRGRNWKVLSKRCDLPLVESKEDGWSLMDRGCGVVPGGGSEAGRLCGNGEEQKLVDPCLRVSRWVDDAVRVERDEVAKRD